MYLESKGIILRLKTLEILKLVITPFIYMFLKYINTFNGQMKFYFPILFHYILLQLVAIWFIVVITYFIYCIMNTEIITIIYHTII